METIEKALKGLQEIIANPNFHKASHEAIRVNLALQAELLKRGIAELKLNTDYERNNAQQSNTGRD